MVQNKMVFFSAVVLVISIFCAYAISGTLVKSVSAQTSRSDNAVYREVSDLAKKQDYDMKKKAQKLDLAYRDLAIKIRYISDRAYIAMGNTKDASANWKPLKINFYYDISFEGAAKDIHLLLKDNDTSQGYILFPAFTEQYASYFVYSFKGKTLDYLGNYVASDFTKGTFSFDAASKELYRSADKTAKFSKENDTSTNDDTHLAADLSLLKTPTDTQPTTSLDKYLKDDRYFIKTFDVNKDGIDDKIVSHNANQGSELLIFLGDKDNNYRLALTSTNFSEDGGNQISDINETQDGYKIITEFPDRGRFDKTYFITALNNSFILKRIETRAHTWQNGYTESCVYHVNTSLEQEENAVSNAIAKAEKRCVKVYDNKMNQGPEHAEWLGAYEGSFLRMKDESADPRAWGTIRLEIGVRVSQLHVDSYKEDVKKGLKVVSFDAQKIQFALLTNEKQTLTLTLDKNTYILSGTLMEQIVGARETYELEKK